MADLTRKFDWANSPVGHPDKWPQSLRTTVTMILASKFPMFLLWGNELTQFYNDAYRPSLGNEGKHPAALGQSGKDCWPEIWPSIKPLIDQVMAGGEAVWMENQLIPIYRNGRLEDAYWTYSYGPVLNESEEIGGVLVVCQETTGSVISRKKVELSESRFRSIVEQSPMAICLLRGREMVIEIGNKSLYEVWDKDKSIIGMQLLDALPEIRDQVFINLLQKVFDTGEQISGQGIRAKLKIRGDWKDVYFDFVYTALLDENNVISGVMVLAIEVTEQVLSRQKVESSEMRYRNLSEQLDQQVQQRTEQLQTSVQNLERSNESLQQFAYVASHDLQEPLRKIQSFGDLLKKNFPDELGTGGLYLERMQSAASRMSNLIDDLLTLARIPVHQKMVALVSINEIIQQVLIDLELIIQQSGTVLTIGKLPSIPGDISQLGQLFQNLISNAVKFQNPGITPVILIDSQIIAFSQLPDSVKPAQLSDNYYRIDVTDNGIGFNPKYKERIFQVFQRLHGKNEFAGTGIGLSICDKVTINHGGAISATSQTGTGSVFSVYFPV